MRCEKHHWATDVPCPYCRMENPTVDLAKYHINKREFLEQASIAALPAIISYYIENTAEEQARVAVAYAHALWVELEKTK